MSRASSRTARIRELQKNDDRSLQHLIDEAYRIFGNPILLYDADFKILAYPEGIITDDPAWINHINDNAVDKNIGVFVKEGFVDLMLGPDKVVLLKSEKIKYDRIFGKIYDNDSNILAGVSIVAYDRPFEDEDFMATEAICKVLSNEILKIPYFQNYAQNKLETCINMLIDRELKTIEDKLYIAGYVEMVYQGLKDNLYLAVADITKCDPTHAELEYYRDLFKRTRPAFKYAVYSNHIVFIMSTGDRRFSPKRCFNRLNRLFEQNDIYVGISCRFENLFDLRKHYNDAVDALNNGLQSGRSRRVFQYSVAD